MTDGRIGLEIADGGIANVVLDRPARRNALTDVMFATLAQTVVDLAARDDVRVVTIQGAGDAFCAGGDVDEMLAVVSEGAGDDEFERRARRASGIVRNLSELPAPTIAGVCGPAIGGGACLALACDHVVAARDAKLGFPFTRLGAPGGDMLAPWLLARRVGTRRALQLLLDGATLTGEAAARIGLVDEVTHADAVAVVVAERAARWASAAPNAMRVTKATVSRLELTEDALTHQLDFEVRAGVEAMGGAEMREGLAAIRARRPPDFRAR